MKQFAFALALVVLAGPVLAATDLSTPGTPGGPIIVPDLELCASQPMLGTATAVSSEVTPTLESRVANDFTFSSARKIIHARWWGQYYNYSANMPDARTFNLFWYYGLQTCAAFPEPPFCTYVVPNNAGETLVAGTPSQFVYNVDLNLDCCFQGSTQFWFVAQCGLHRELAGAGQWGRKGCPIVACESMIRSVYFGIPNWTPLSALGIANYDASQEFDCGDCGVTPTDATTWGTIKTLYQ